MEEQQELHWRQYVIAAPVAERLHFKQGHPRATLLYLRLLTLLPAWWSDATHLHFDTPGDLVTCLRLPQAWPGVAQVLRQTLPIWDATEHERNQERARRALWTEGGWQGRRI